MPNKNKIVPVQAAGLTCADACKLLEISRPHLTTLIKSGQIKAERVGKRVLIVDPASVAEYAQNPKRRDRRSTTDTRKKRPSLKELADRCMAVAKEAHDTTVNEIKSEKKSVFVKIPTTTKGMSDISMRRDLAVAEYGEKAVELFDHIAAYKDKKRQKTLDAIQKASKRIAKKAKKKTRRKVRV